MHAPDALTLAVELGKVLGPTGIALMIWVLRFLVVLFFLKVLWNLAVPYVLAGRRLQDPKASSTKGISLMPMIEILLICLASILSLMTGPFRSPLSPSAILLYGFGIAIGTYLHFFVGSIVAHWVMRLSKGGP